MSISKWKLPFWKSKKVILLLLFAITNFFWKSYCYCYCNKILRSYCYCNNKKSYLQEVWNWSSFWVWSSSILKSTNFCVDIFQLPLYIFWGQSKFDLKDPNFSSLTWEILCGLCLAMTLKDVKRMLENVNTKICIF